MNNSITVLVSPDLLRQDENLSSTYHFRFSFYLYVDNLSVILSHRSSNNGDACIEHFLRQEIGDQHFGNQIYKQTVIISFFLQNLWFSEWDAVFWWLVWLVASHRLLIFNWSTKVFGSGSSLWQCGVLFHLKTRHWDKRRIINFN